MHGLEFTNKKLVFHTVESIITTIRKDDTAKYLLFLENMFQYMDKSRYEFGMQAIIEEMTTILSDDSVGKSADRACLLDARAVLEKNTKKQIELVEEAIRILGDVHSGNAHLAANLHANLGALYHKAGCTDLLIEGTTYDNHQITAVNMHKEKLDDIFLIRYPLVYDEQIRFLN